MPWIELKSPNTPRRVIEIGKAGATLGRARDNTIPLDDVKSSSHHAAIVYVSAGKDAEKEPERWIVSDAGSKNGTFVDSRKLEHGEEVDLQATTKIKIGKSVMRFHFEKPPETIAASVEADDDDEDGGEVVAVAPATVAGGKNGSAGTGQSDKKPAAKPAAAKKADAPAADKPAAAAAVAVSPAAVANAEAAAPAADVAPANAPSADETMPAPVPPPSPVVAEPAAPEAVAPAAVAPAAEPAPAEPAPAAEASPVAKQTPAAVAVAPAAAEAAAAAAAAPEPAPAHIKPTGRTSQAAARTGLPWREHAVTAGITGLVAIIAFAFGHVSNGASDQQRERLDEIAANTSKTADLPRDVRLLNERMVGLNADVRDLDGELEAIDSDLRTLGTDLATIAAIARETQRGQQDTTASVADIAPVLEDMLTAMAALQSTTEEQRDTIAALRERLDALERRPVQPPPSNTANSGANSGTNRPAANNAANAGNNAGNTTQETVVVPDGWHNLYGRGVPPAQVWLFVIEGSSSMTDPLDPNIDPRDQLGRRSQGNLPGDTRWESRFNRAVADTQKMVAFAQSTEDVKASIVIGSSAAKYMLDERVLPLDSTSMQRRLEREFPLLFALGSFSLTNSLQAAGEGGEGCVPRRGSCTINLIVMSDEEDVDDHVSEFRDLTRKLKTAGEGGHTLHAFWVSYRPTEPAGLDGMKAAVTELKGIIADHKPQ